MILVADDRTFFLKIAMGDDHMRHVDMHHYVCSLHHVYILDSWTVTVLFIGFLWDMPCARIWVITSHTNQRVLDILRDSHQIRIDLFSHTWLKRKLKLFGHILRTSSDDPLRQVLFEYNTFIPRIEYRRPGQPRTSWLLQAFKEVFETLGRVEEYNYDNPEHQNFVLQKATERQGVFA